MTRDRGKSIPYPENHTTRHVRKWRADALNGQHPSNIWIIEVGEIAGGWYVLRHVTGWMPGGCRLYASHAQAVDVSRRLREHMSGQEPERRWYIWGHSGAQDPTP